MNDEVYHLKKALLQECMARAQLTHQFYALQLKVLEEKAKQAAEPAPSTPESQATS